MVATPKMYTEQCTNCGTDVNFNAEVIRQDNPYWPWIDSNQLQNLTAGIQTLSLTVKELTNVIRTPQEGLIAQIKSLVKCFETLLAPLTPAVVVEAVETEEPSP